MHEPHMFANANETSQSGAKVQFPTCAVRQEECCILQIGKREKQVFVLHVSVENQYCIDCTRQYYRVKHIPELSDVLKKHHLFNLVSCKSYLSLWIVLNEYFSKLSGFVLNIFEMKCREEEVIVRRQIISTNQQVFEQTRFQFVFQLSTGLILDSIRPKQKRYF